jgi:tRNA-Thr(GGU) m(6)t(6)A37 methyltransferase TsaA
LSMDIKPVGYVRSSLKDVFPSAADDNMGAEERMRKIRERHRTIKSHVCELVVNQELAEALDGIDEFSHIVVVYWAHLLPEKRRDLLRVHPMGRKELPLTGIFATRSPARPNPVLISTVKLLAHKGNTLRVLGLEALDGSPVIDIKPYVRDFDGVEKCSVPAWLRQIRKDMEGDVALPPYG